MDDAPKNHKDEIPHIRNPAHDGCYKDSRDRMALDEHLANNGERIDPKQVEPMLVDDRADRCVIIMKQQSQVDGICDTRNRGRGILGKGHDTCKHIPPPDNPENGDDFQEN